MKNYFKRLLAVLLVGLILSGSVNPFARSEPDAIQPSEMEEDMATGDKLVNLDGLKTVYDKVNGDVSGLKSANAHHSGIQDTSFKKVASNFAAKTDYSAVESGNADANYDWGFIIKASKDFITFTPALYNGIQGEEITWKRYTNGLGTVFVPTDSYTLVDSGIAYNGVPVVLMDVKVGEFFIFASSKQFKYASSSSGGIDNVFNMLGIRKSDNQISITNGFQLSGSYSVYTMQSVDVKSLEQDVNSLDDNYDELADLIGFAHAYTSPNIFDKSDSDIITGGYITTDGSIAENANLYETGYIPCAAGDILRCINNGAFLTTSNVIMAFYDNSKQFIKTKNYPLNNISYSATDVPNGAYIRIPINKNFSKDTLIITKNDTTLYTEYKPYGEIAADCELDNRVTAIEEQLQQGQWEGKNCVCIGDSIMWYDGHELGQTGVIAVGYPSYLRNELKMTVSNQGVSGACVAYHEDRIYVDNVTTVDSIDFSNYDLAVLEGGINDYLTASPIGSLQSSSFDKTTLIGAYQYIIEKILTDNPEIQIVMFLPYKVDYHSSSQLPLSDYISAIESVAEYYSIPLVDLYRKCGFNKKNILSTYTLDGLHANNPGYKRTNDILISALNNIGLISQRNDE